MSIEYQCEWCHKKFIAPPSRSKAKHICCSKECQSNLKKQLTRKQHTPNATCPICGEEFWVKPSQLERYNVVCCSKKCSLEWRKIKMTGENNHQYGLIGEANSSWKSNEKITNYGYKQIRVLDHPFGTSEHWVFEHRLVAEKYLLTEENSVEINGKKYLKPEYDVHHIDENRLNNSVENLLVLLKSDHRRLHCIQKPRTRDKSGKFAKTENGENKK